jgi:hypothetical protein
MYLKSLADRIFDSAGNRQQALEEKKIMQRAKKVAGRPWWESSNQTFLCTYDDVDQINDELRFAEPLGWSIDSTDSIDGHVHVGRAVLSGGLTLLAKGGRSKGKTTITWTRQAR